MGGAVFGTAATVVPCKSETREVTAASVRPKGAAGRAERSIQTMRGRFSALGALGRLHSSRLDERQPSTRRSSSFTL